ncbi:MAG: DUF1501 domain-containing protein [Acidimicrobiales bacterium]
MTVHRFANTPDPELREAYKLLHTPPRTDGDVERRRFLQGMLAVGGVAALGLPNFAGEAGAQPLGKNDRILVVLLLSGGNDGLNTVVPANSGQYYDRRRSLAVSQNGLHGVGDGQYLHRNLSKLKARYDSGEVAIVQGVGDPLDDHSHFVNLARWMAGSARPEPWYTGWLGRYLDGVGASGLAGVSIGHSGAPLLLARAAGESTSVPPYGRLFGMNRWERGPDRPTYDNLLDLNTANVNHGSVARDVALNTKSAIRTAVKVGPIFPEDDPVMELNDQFMIDATLVARLINLDVGARVITIALGGFDHHENQRPEHDNFMRSLDNAIDRIFKRVQPRLRDQVMVMTYSEFGRRVEGTATGTDHGTAGPMIVAGAGVRGGMYGQTPSLGNLDSRGDLRHHVNFRSVYATVLEDWLDADSNEVLGGNFERLNFVGGVGGPRCEGLSPTIVGTAGDDVLVGTPGRDVILAKGGNDVVRGLGGNDVVCAGPGQDKVYGGKGHDTIYGQGGNDILNGGPGNDKAVGGKGADKLLGKGGEDVLKGQRGKDELRGGKRRDQLDGGTGADKIYGDRRRDDIVATAIDKILSG